MVNSLSRWFGILLLMLSLSSVATLSTLAQTRKPLPSLREQAEIQQEWLKLRLERVLPRLMRKHGVAMWLVICREYNEDPVFFSLVSPTMFAARRRTIYVFFDRGEREGNRAALALGGGSNGGLYTVYRDPEVEGREIYGEGSMGAAQEADRRAQALDDCGQHLAHPCVPRMACSAGEREKIREHARA